MLHTLSSIRSPSRLGGPQKAPQLLLEGRSHSPYGAPRQAYVPEARNLFPATPQPKSSSSGGGDPSLPEDVSLSVLLPLCSLTSTWLRSMISGNLGRCDAQTAARITDALCSSALLAMRLSRPLLLSVGHDMQAVQSVLLGALPSLCK
jgi:hypothetical protein